MLFRILTDNFFFGEKKLKKFITSLARFTKRLKSFSVQKRKILTSVKELLPPSSWALGVIVLACRVKDGRTGWSLSLYRLPAFKLLFRQKGHRGGCVPFYFKFSPSSTRQIWKILSPRLPLGWLTHIFLMSRYA